jgi:hypothetical protein
VKLDSELLRRFTKDDPALLSLFLSAAEEQQLPDLVVSRELDASSAVRVFEENNVLEEKELKLSGVEMKQLHKLGKEKEEDDDSDDDDDDDDDEDNDKDEDVAANVEKDVVDRKSDRPRAPQIAPTITSEMMTKMLLSHEAKISQLEALVAQLAAQVQTLALKKKGRQSGLLSRSSTKI